MGWVMDGSRQVETGCSPPAPPLAVANKVTVFCGVFCQVFFFIGRAMFPRQMGTVPPQCRHCHVFLCVPRRWPPVAGHSMGNAEGAAYTPYAYPRPYGQFSPNPMAAGPFPQHPSGPPFCSQTVTPPVKLLSFRSARQVCRCVCVCVCCMFMCMCVCACRCVYVGYVWMDRWIDGRMDRWMDVHVHTHTYALYLCMFYNVYFAIQHIVV